MGDSQGSPSGGRCGPNCSQAETSRELTVQALARGQEALWTVLEEQTVYTAYLSAGFCYSGVETQ